MCTPFDGRIRKTVIIIAVIAMALLICLGPGSSSTASAQESKYFSIRTIKLKDGTNLDEYIINGPPVPPPGYDLQRKTVTLPKPNAALGINTLTVPAFRWSFGCSATSGAMIAAYYDRNGFPNMYTGPTNGGVMPLDSSPWPDWTDGAGKTWAQCPLTASHQGLDGRTTRGSIDDYWVSYLSTAQDPYITNGWTQHTWGEAIGDYMKTSQSAYNNNVDGATTFVYYTTPSPSPLTCSAIASDGVSDIDGTYGRKLFYEARGYTVTDCYNQDTDNTIAGGFSFAQYKAEIDAGRPVMLELVGHTIVGVGYDDTSNTIYIHDTWDNYTHTMTWGGSYAGMQLLFASIVNLQTNTPMYVKPAASGAGNCQSWDNACTLQTALANAASGNEIWVAAGTYTPTAEMDRTATFQLKTGVAIYGGFAGTETVRTQRDPTAHVTILSGDIGTSGDASDNSYHVVTGATGATLDGFTISGGNGNGTAPNERGAGMYNQNCSPTLANVTISGNTAVFGGGIFNDTSSPTLTNVTFSGNTATNSGGGMYSSHNTPTLTDVNFTNNSAPYGGGMENDNSNPTLTGGTFNDNTATANGGGMLNGGSSGSNPTLTNVTFSNNTATSDGGGMLNSSSSPTFTNVTFSGNSAGSEGGGMYNQSNSNPTLTDVNFTNNSASNGGGMENINKSNPLVTGGAFTGNQATSNGGGMSNENYGTNPTLMNVLFSSNTASNDGGGMYNTSASSPKLTNVTFNNNQAYLGGGMYNGYYFSNPTLTNVTFSGNSASWGGGMYNDNSGPGLTDVTFSGNTASINGGGMEDFSGSGSGLTDVTFSGNTASNEGGGMYVDRYCYPALTNITFSGNSAASGGGIFNNSIEWNLTNITFNGNSAVNGGGMYNANGDAILTNVTFSGNSASQSGGGMYNYFVDDFPPQIRNTILWGNMAVGSGAQIWNNGTASKPVLSYSVVQGGCPSGSTCTNILTTDPLLGTLGNYGAFTLTIPLLAGSSAIDTGDDSVCPATDQRGVKRPQGAHCDIGAYEFNYMIFLPLVLR